MASPRSAQLTAQRLVPSSDYVCLCCRLSASPTSTSTTRPSGSTSKRGEANLRLKSRAAAIRRFHSQSKHDGLIRRPQDNAFIRPLELAYNRSDEISLPNAPVYPNRTAPPIKPTNSSSIRSQLKRFREDNPDTTVAHGRPVPSQMIQLPLPKSISQANNDPGSLKAHDLGGADTEDARAEMSTIKDRLVTGDVLMIHTPARPPRIPTLSVFVRTVDGQAQFVLVTGEFYVTEWPRVMGGVLDSYMPNELIAPAIPHLPTSRYRQSVSDDLTSYSDGWGVPPLAVSAPLMAVLAKLQTESSSFRRSHRADFDAFFDRLAQEDVDSVWEWSDVASRVFNKKELSSAAKLAVTSFHAQVDHGIQILLASQVAVQFLALSRQQKRTLDAVTDWAREYQEAAAKAASGQDVRRALRDNPLTGFIAKAQRLILASRQHRSPTTIGRLGPCAHTLPKHQPQFIKSSEVFTEEEKTIVEFLALVHGIAPTAGSCRSTSAVICRAIGAYSGVDLDESVVWVLLQELGLVRPWTDKSLYSRVLWRAKDGQSIAQDQSTEKVETSVPDLGPFADSLASLRQDWGQLPIYCIDSADTVEVDDAISIEPSAADPEAAWIHVHIANPAAFFPREHAMGELAEQRFQSIYWPHLQISMLPARFVQDFASLAPNRPVMTVSTLVGADGSVLERKVSLGTVHNVIRLTHDDVHSLLRVESGKTASLTVGGPMKRVVDSDAAAAAARRLNAEKALPDLRRIHAVVLRNLARRRDNWPDEDTFNLNMSGQATTVSTDHREEMGPRVSKQPGHWIGDPAIQLRRTMWESEAEGRRVEDGNIVALCMVLTGESVAQWCRDRQVPVLYHAVAADPRFPISRLRELPAVGEHYRLLPAMKLSSTPDRHLTLQLDQYMRVTSPLRRYVDLVNQWQILAHLQGAEYPFSADEISSMVESMPYIMKNYRYLSLSSRNYWMLYALFRAHHFPDASRPGAGSLPAVWDFHLGHALPSTETLRVSWTKLEGRLLPFDARALLLKSEPGWETTGLKRGMYLPVELVSVEVDKEYVTVRAVGPPSKEPTVKGPFNVEC